MQSSGRATTPTGMTMDRNWTARIVGIIVIAILLFVLFSLQNRLTEMARAREAAAGTR